MCLICVEFQKNRMTVGEARRALREMVEGLDAEHVEEVRGMLARAEDGQARDGQGGGPAATGQIDPD